MSPLSPESRRNELPAVFSADSTSLKMIKIKKEIKIKMEAVVIRTLAMVLRRDRS